MKLIGMNFQPSSGCAKVPIAGRTSKSDNTSVGAASRKNDLSKTAKKNPYKAGAQSELSRLCRFQGLDKQRQDCLLRLKVGNQWKTLGLTCHHVVLPSTTTHPSARLFELYRIMLEENPAIFMDMPSLLDHPQTTES